MSDPKNDLPHRTSAPQWRKRRRLDGKPRSRPRGRHAKPRTDDDDDDDAHEPVAVPVHQRLGFLPAEFAALTGVSYVTVWRGIKSGKIKVIDQNGIQIIPRSFVVEAGYLARDDGDDGDAWKRGSKPAPGGASAVTNSNVSQKKANVFPVVPAVPAGRYSWENPDESLLEDRRGDLPEFPHETIPSGLQGWLLLATRGAGVRTDHIAVPMLGVASSLIGKARRIRASSSWLEPMTLWVCVVAASGDRKTPGFQVVLRALDRIEKENTPQYREARLAHQLRAEKAKAELKRWRKACQEALEAKPPGEPPPMPIDAVDPGEFIHPSLYVQDCTIQRLAKLCNVRPRGMLQIRDEMSGLFANMQRQSSARAFYLEAWNGLRYVVERVDDERSIEVENLLVGLMGGFQPDKLCRAFSGDEDGMYARFLFGWPTTPAYSPLTDDVAEVAPEFQRLLTRLIRLPAEDQDGQFAPRIIPLSADARASFEDYRRYVDQTKRALEGREQQWLVKSETQVLRLAGTLAYLDWASLQDTPSSAMGVERISASLEPDTIGERFMADAIRLMREYFWPHARAALRQIGLTDRHMHMRRTLRWIRVHRMEVVSVQDVRREALGGSLDADQTLELLDRMTTAGWLRPERISTGGRPLERWHVNPKIFETATAETAGTAESPEQSPELGTFEQFLQFLQIRKESNK